MPLLYLILIFFAVSSARAEVSPVSLKLPESRFESLDLPVLEHAGDIDLSHNPFSYEERIMESDTSEECRLSRPSDFKGVASIVFFYTGDPEWTNLAQETINLSHAFSGADYKVLLIDEGATFGTEILKDQALDQADRVLDPNARNFLNAIQDATDKGYKIDVWIFGHGSHRGESGLISMQGGDLTSRDLVEMRFENRCDYPVRMVYSITCDHDLMTDAWLYFGAQVTAGARGVNFYPTQYRGFVEAWNDGRPFDAALQESDTNLSRTLVQSYIEASALFSHSGQGDCSWIPNVLGYTDCAEYYFKDKWGATGAEFNAGGGSGSGFMSYSSHQILNGNGNFRKTSSGTWMLPR